MQYRLDFFLFIAHALHMSVPCKRLSHGNTRQEEKSPELLKTERSGMNSYPLLQYRGSIIELYGQKKILISALCYFLCVKNRLAGYSLLS